MVNLVSFFILRKLKVELNIANIISIILAILFAYVVNSKYVFQDKCETLKDHVQPFCKFVSARLVTMVIEVGGVSTGNIGIIIAAWRAFVNPFGGKTVKEKDLTRNVLAGFGWVCYN